MIADARRALDLVIEQLQAIERQVDATGEPLAGDKREVVFDRLVTALGVMDEYLTGRLDSSKAIHQAAQLLLDGYGHTELELSDDQSTLLLDAFPTRSDYILLADGAPDEALQRWLAMGQYVGEA
jgi:hypothetical protein